MIELKLKNEEKPRQFNLKNFDREKALVNAWKAMSGDETYATKKFKITIHTGDVLEMNINDIEDCKFDESIYCEGKVC